jgi:hypothetical protein
MRENGSKPVELTLVQMVERYRQQKAKGRELVEAMFHEAVERERLQRQQEHALVEQLHRQAIEQGRLQPLPPHEPPTLDYTELPPALPNSRLCQEWEYYRREVGRLLTEGKEGQFVLIQGQTILGTWDTREEAEAVAFHRCPLEPHLIHQVQRRERLLRGPSRLWRCPG